MAKGISGKVNPLAHVCEKRLFLTQVLVGGKVTQHVLVHTVEKNLSVFDVEHELMPNYESQRLR